MFTNSELTDDTFSCWDNHDLISIDFNSIPIITPKEIPLPILANNTPKVRVIQLNIIANIANNIDSNTKKPTKKKEKLAQDPPQVKDVCHRSNEVFEFGEAHKEMHNATEKRRREKINSKINELRDLILQCKNYRANKVAILNHTVEYIKQMNANYAQLMATNRQQQDTNAQLLTELREVHRILWVKAKEQGYEAQMRGMSNVYQPLNPITTNVSTSNTV